MTGTTDGYPWASSPLAVRMRAAVTYNLLGAAFNQGSTLVVNLVVANMLGREPFGRYTMVLATISTAATLAQLSMGYTATKHVAEFRESDPGRASRILGLCAAVSLLSAILTGGVLALGAPWLARTVLGTADLAPELRLAAAAVFFSVLSGFSTGALAGLESYVALARAGAITGTLYVIVCVVFAAAGGLPGAVAGVALSAAGQAGVLGVLLTKEARRKGLAVTTRGAWEERAIVSTFAVPASLNGLVALPAIWMASAIVAQQPRGYHELALFGAANTFRTMVLFVPQAINNVGMSLLNSQRRASAGGYRSIFWMNLILTALSAAGAALLVLLAGPFLLRLFGPGFREGWPVLAILLGAAVVEALAIALYQTIVSAGRIWASLFFVALPRDTTLVVAAALLVPGMGAFGLGSAYLIAWCLALLAIAALGSRLGHDAAHPVTVSAR